MSFLKNLFGPGRLDGLALVQSPQMADYAQIDLLSRFSTPSPLPEQREQQIWNRVLPHTVEQQIRAFQKQNWLEEKAGIFQVTAAGQSIVAAYRSRQEAEKERAMAGVRDALAQKDTSRALQIRRSYEAHLPPLGKADWTGPEPQLSHSALSRRILFLDHWLLEGFNAESAAWIKMIAAEQHLWGAFWRLEPSQIPAPVQAELAADPPASVEALYWKAYQLALYVDNQETWQRCKGGDHVRRLEIFVMDDEFTCDTCREFRGRQFLVARIPDLPHRGCGSTRGCRCRYEPVLDMYDEPDRGADGTG